MTTNPVQRVFAVLLTDESAAHELLRQAEGVLDMATSLTCADFGPVELIAVLTGREHDTALLDQFRQLPFSVVVSVVAPDLRLPSQPSDIARVLAVALGKEATAGVEAGITAEGTTRLTAQDVVCIPACDLGEAVAMRVAAAFDGATFGRVHRIGFDERGAFADKSTFGGRARIRVRAAIGPWFCALRTEAAPEASTRQPRNQPAPLQEEIVSAGPFDASEIIWEPIGEQQRPVETARLVVGGGRGMQGPEGFALLERLARMFDGAVGGSLPAVDAGWVPVTHQVGQSGKFVSPEIYVTVAISGTPQHLAGVDRATRIVAINNDEHADIFKVAELGIVANWVDFLPALLARLDVGRGSRDTKT